MQVLISAVALILGIVVLMSGHHDPTLKRSATGWIGAVIGYWLH
jgi:hypothetical protein